MSSRRCKPSTELWNDQNSGVFPSFRSALARKKLGVVCCVDERLGTSLRGNAACLREVFAALASNAVKFTGEGGEIHIDVDFVDDSDDDVEVKASVRDTGIGIPDDAVGHLFRPFVQVDGSTERKYGGMGLGLATSKQIVEMMGGRIGFQRNTWKGSTFWFSLKLKKQGATPHETRL